MASHTDYICVTTYLRKIKCCCNTAVRVLNLTCCFKGKRQHGNEENDEKKGTAKGT